MEIAFLQVSLALIVGSSYSGFNLWFRKQGVRNFRIRAGMTISADLLFLAYILSEPVQKHWMLTNRFNLEMKVTEDAQCE